MIRIDVLSSALLLAAAWLIAGSLVTPARAQLGSGWTPTNFTKSVHLDDDVGLQTFKWTPSQSVCAPTSCADYNYNSATDTETFRIFDSRSNRSEIRLQNNYDDGIWQFEGYVTFYAPVEDESLFQIFGNSGEAATYLMMRGYNDNGGEIRVMGGSHVIASGVYGQEVRINVIHEQDVSAKFYVNGEFIYEKPDTDYAATNYWKYGVYGTTNGNVPAVVEWRSVRTFRDGLPPGAIVDIPGDLNADGQLDALDWTLFKSGQGLNFSHFNAAQALAHGDLDGDFDHDLDDFVAFRSAFELARGSGSFAQLLAAGAEPSVPEPSSAALLSTAGVTAVGLAWRRSRCKDRPVRLRSRCHFRLP